MGMDTRRATEGPGSPDARIPNDLHLSRLGWDAELFFRIKGLDKAFFF